MSKGIIADNANGSLDLNVASQSLTRFQIFSVFQHAQAFAGYKSRIEVYRFKVT